MTRRFIGEFALKPKGSEGIGLSCEYYRIDVTSWKDRAAEIKDDAPKNFTPYFWDLEVAVEHENYDRHWMDEVVKLAHINCPLRVVIGYLPVGTDHSNYIAYVSAALKMLRCKQVSDNEFLLLIGNSKVKSVEECFNYQPYLFDGNAFELQASWLQKE